MCFACWHSSNMAGKRSAVLQKVFSEQTKANALGAMALGS